MGLFFSDQETIAAIATPPGEGGIAVIRISGKEAIAIADRIFSGSISSFVTHTVHYGEVRTLEGESVDRVLLLVMKAPRSYTGEDTIEIHCHGGSLISRRVLEVVLSAGARPARPGEFTYRSFRNGKIDLAQAEAVQALIGARSDEALIAAEQQLHGRLSERVTGFQQALTKTAALFEAWVDFPEEGLAFASFEEVVTSLQNIQQEIQALVATFDQGKVLHEGLSLCLVGAPNVGKSSLMNALLDKERAIVSSVAGTTRDLVEDHMRFQGFHFRVIDTAGIRHSEEEIEKEGIRRTKEVIQEADLLFLVLDASRPLCQEEETLLQEVSPEKTIAIWNKIDIQNTTCSLALPHVVALSAKEKQGLDALRAEMEKLLWKKGPPSKEEVVLTQVRHYQALVAAVEALQKVVEGMEEERSPELLLMDLRESLEHLGSVTGADVTEDILKSIFSQLCIGK